MSFLFFMFQTFKKHNTCNQWDMEYVPPHLVAIVLHQRWLIRFFKRKQAGSEACQKPAGHTSWRNHFRRCEAWNAFNAFHKAMLSNYSWLEYTLCLRVMLGFPLIQGMCCYLAVNYFLKILFNYCSYANKLASEIEFHFEWAEAFIYHQKNSTCASELGSDRSRAKASFL